MIGFRGFAAVAFLVDAAFVSKPPVSQGERAVAALDWSTSTIAAECMEASKLTRDVESRLHRTVFVPSSQADIQMHVNLDSTSAGNWTAAIDLEDRNGNALGHRELTISAERCSALNESLVLMVSLMLDVTRESVKPEAPRAAPSLAPASTQAPPTPNVRRENDSPLRGRAYVLGSVRSGQLPGLGRGLTLQGELSSQTGWAAFASATLWAPGQHSENGFGAKFWLTTGEVNACGAVHSNRSSDVYLCSGYQLGVLGSRAFGFDVNGRKTTVFHDLTLRLRATWWATASFGLHGTLGAALPLVQEEYFGTRSDGTELRLLSRPLIVPLADFGIAVRFGP